MSMSIYKVTRSPLFGRRLRYFRPTSSLKSPLFSKFLRFFDKNLHYISYRNELFEFASVFREADDLFF